MKNSVSEIVLGVWTTEDWELWNFTSPQSSLNEEGTNQDECIVVTWGPPCVLKVTQVLPSFISKVMNLWAGVYGEVKTVISWSIHHRPLWKKEQNNNGHWLHARRSGQIFVHPISTFVLFAAFSSFESKIYILVFQTIKCTFLYPEAWAPVIL